VKDMLISESLQWHIENDVPIDENIFRPGSREFFRVIREARSLYNQGIYVPIDEVEREWLHESDVGEWALYEGVKVPLDFPMLYEPLSEAKYKGKNVELNKPKRGSGGRAYVYVRDPQSGNVRKVSFGSSMPDAMGDSPAARKRRKSFGDRHNCADKKDKTQAGYWSCRATKFFGRSIPGWW